MPLQARSRSEPVSSFWQGPGLVAGVDEAGRGPLAGPVVAVAVILDDRKPIAGLRDSKALTPKARDRLHDTVRADALCCSIGQASVVEIDQLNILRATLLAMRRAVEGLRLEPRCILVDGKQVPQVSMAARPVVRGDARVEAIAAASIVAKVHRDRLCAELHERHPGYGFGVHKGYPTAAHLEALQRLGPCEAHRRTFAPVRALLQASAGDL